MSLLATGLIMGGNLLGSAFASHQSGKANRKVRAGIDQQINELEGLFSQEKHREPFSRPDVQAALGRTRESLRDMTKQQRDNAIRSGATTESQVAAGRSAGKGYADAMTNILQHDRRSRDMAKNRYQQMLMGLRGNKTQIDLQDAQRWPQLMQNMAGLSSAAVDILG